MNMKTKYPIYIEISIIIAMFLLALYFYPLMPYKMVTHFDFYGIPNGFMGRFWGIFLLPFISLLLYVLFRAILYIDPLKENIKSFRIYYNVFVDIFLILMLYLELSLILWNVGIKINILRFLTIPIGLFYIYIGVLLGKSKRNWFIGIRTPWTLTSDYVWDKTNKLAGKFFIIDGIFVMLSFFFSRLLLIFMLYIVLLGLFIIAIYSYVLWAKTKTEELK